MVENYRARKRQIRRLSSIVGVSVAFCLVIWFLFAFMTPHIWPYRVSGIIIGNPGILFSLNSRRNTLTLFTIPRDARFEGTSDVGLYSFDALWRLDQLEKTHSLLTLESVESLFETPLSWYIGIASDKLKSTDNPVNAVQQIFSESGFTGLIIGKYRTNIRLPTFLNLWWWIRNVHPDHIDVVNLDRTNVLLGVQLPDGTSTRTIDTERLDSVIMNKLQDDDIRLESVRIAIYNTTQTRALGTRVGRMLSHAGALVVFIGNDNGEAIDRCQLSGTKQALASLTSRFIVSYFGCLTIERPTPDRAELVMKIGSEYQKRFLPPQK